MHNQVVTFRWACDVHTSEGGAIKVIPGSHVQRRPPNAKEIAAQQGVTTVECLPGSVTVFDGSVWHGSHPRTIAGEQVVLEVSYIRLALRPVENYEFLRDDWLLGKPYALRVLLGREDGLNTPQGVFGKVGNIAKLPRLMNWSKN